jgi:hypothetical protein
VKNGDEFTPERRVTPPKRWISAPDGNHPHGPRDLQSSLRLIGAFSINDGAADDEHVQEALYWLDMQQAELAGKVQCFWLMTETLSFDLTAGTASYDLKEALDEDWPAEGIEYIAARGWRTPKAPVLR